jgi:3-ketosteroid 9alpha-monooxygenase subunit A
MTAGGRTTTVRGDCVPCPHHGWTYGADGVNRSIPDEDRTNPSKRLPVWSVVEQYDCIFVWHQPHDDAPRWEMPDLFTSSPSLDVDPAQLLPRVPRVLGEVRG